MSTELKNIQASIEVPNTRTRHSDYVSIEVNLTEFWGGTGRNKSLQLGFLDETNTYKHIQLDNKNVQLLKDILKDF